MQVLLHNVSICWQCTHAVCIVCAVFAFVCMVLAWCVQKTPSTGKLATKGVFV